MGENFTSLSRFMSEMQYLSLSYKPKTLIISFVVFALLGIIGIYISK